MRTPSVRCSLGSDSSITRDPFLILIELEPRMGRMHRWHSLEHHGGYRLSVIGSRANGCRVLGCGAEFFRGKGRDLIPVTRYSDFDVRRNAVHTRPPPGVLNLLAISEERSMIRSILDGINLKSRSGRRCGRWHRRRLGGLECLEGRVLLSGNPTVYTVNLTTDAGPTSAGSGSGDTGDLRYVINLANADPNTAGTLIEFDPTVFATAKTITLSPTLGTLALLDTAGPEVIDGPGGGLVTVSGNNAVGVFSVASGVTASISGLTINAGSTAANGGGIDNSGSLALTSDTISDNAATGSGGGIDNESTGTLTVAQSILTNNTAANAGGGIENSGSLTVTSDTFDGNTATYGLGGAIDNAGALTVTNSTFTGGNAFRAAPSTTEAARSPSPIAALARTPPSWVAPSTTTRSPPMLRQYDRE